MWWDIVKTIIMVAGLSLIPYLIAAVFLFEKLTDRYAAHTVRHLAKAADARVEQSVGGGHDA